MLSDVQVKKAQPKKKKYKLYDKDGLYLLVMPNGSKYFKYDYKYNNINKTYSLGVYPKISLKEAREEIIKIKAVIDKGLNPNEEKRRNRLVKITGDSFAEIAEEWHKIAKNKVTAKHAKDKWRKLERDILPYIGGYNIKDITVPELLSVIRKIEARGAIETAHRTRGIVGEVYAYAIAAGKAERNIAHDLQGALQVKPAVKHMATITQPQQIGGLLRAVWGYEGDEITTAALKLLAYTFLRVSELASLHWADFDREKRLIKIPAERMKKRRPHIVPLSKQAYEILKNLPVITDFIFPSIRTRTRHINPFSLNAALRRLGYQSGEMTAHGFRAMASTTLYENGFSADIIELQLAHAEDNTVKAAYNHALHLQRRADMVQWYADYLDRLREMKA